MIPSLKIFLKSVFCIENSITFETSNKRKMNLKEFIKETFKESYGMCFRPRIVCNDGFSMSVQGSSGHYCQPRLTQDNYISMEIGFPDEEEALIMGYAENPSNPTETVYSCVPIEIIEQVILKHGGINISATIK